MHTTRLDRQAAGIALCVLLGVAILPWYAIQDGFWSTQWLGAYPMSGDSAPALFLWLQGRNLWLLPVGALGLLALLAGLRRFPQAAQARILTFVGLAGIAYMLAQGFLFGLRGWNVAWLAQICWAKPKQRQFGMGYGALVAGAGFLFLLTRGLALRGLVAGDAFVAGSLGLVIALTLLFIGFPVLQMLVIPFRDRGTGLVAGTVFGSPGRSKDLASGVFLFRHDLWRCMELADAGDHASACCRPCLAWPSRSCSLALVCAFARPSSPCPCCRSSRRRS